MQSKACFCIIAALAVTNVATSVKAQPPPSGASGGSGTSSGGGAARPPTPTRPPVAPSSPTPNNNNTQAQNIPRTIFISGKVMMDDASPLPQNIVIQKVCGGNPRSVAYADGRGHFSFQLGGPQTAFLSDASESGISGSRSNSGGFGSAQSGSSSVGGDPFGSQMTNCEVRAQLAGFRSDVASLASRNSLENPDIGVIVLHRLANVEGTSISATSFMAPKDAKKAYQKGLQAALKNKPEEASKEFEKAVLAYPKYADAWMNLGQARMQQKAYEPAREALLKAIEADPKLVGPYVDLGVLAAQQNRWAEAAPYLDRALKLDPIDFPQAWYMDAAAHFNLKKFDLAEKSAREALKTDPKRVNPRTDYLLGLILAEKHDFPGAAEQFRLYLKNAPDSPDFQKVKDQLGQLEKYLAQTKEASKQP